MGSTRADYYCSKSATLRLYYRAAKQLGGNCTPQNPRVCCPLRACADIILAGTYKRQSLFSIHVEMSRTCKHYRLD